MPFEINIFNQSGQTYGYRRVHAMLKRDSITLSEKVVRRIMKEKNLLIKKVRIRKYSSYIGEVSPAVPNRDCFKVCVNSKLLT